MSARVLKPAKSWRGFSDWGYAHTMAGMKLKVLGVRSLARSNGFA